MDDVKTTGQTTGQATQESLPLRMTSNSYVSSRDTENLVECSICGSQVPSASFALHQARCSKNPQYRLVSLFFFF